MEHPPLAVPTNVIFSPLGDDDVVAMGLQKLTSTNTHTGKTPDPNGVNSLRLGTTTPSMACMTCLNDKTDCNGHLGYIPARYPCKNPLFLLEILKVAKLICRGCGKVPITTKDYRSSNLISKIDKAALDHHKCVYCKTRIATVKADDEHGHITLNIHENDRVVTTIYHNHELRKTFEQVTNDTLKLLGMPVHPTKYIVSKLIVSPITIRPDNRSKGVRFSVPDVTALLSLIMAHNTLLPETIPEGDWSNLTDHAGNKLADSYHKLNQLYYVMIVGKAPVAMPANKGLANVRSLMNEISSKTGMIRLNLCSKRAGNHTRAVITANPEVPSGTIEIPEYCAKKLHVNMTVTADNYDECNLLYLNGSTWPGANRVHRIATGKTHIVDSINRTTRLSIGDMLQAHLRDNHVVLFYRSPCLLPSSMLGMRIKVQKGANAFRINAHDMSSFNADCDGDNMSFVVPVDEHADIRMTAKMLSNNIINHQDGMPIVAPIQDDLLAPAVLTSDRRVFHESLVMSWILEAPHNPNYSRANIRKKMRGTEILSVIMPKITHSGTPSSYKKSYEHVIPYMPDDKMFSVHDGVIRGVMDKNAIGGGRRGLSSIIARDPSLYSHWINSQSRITNAYLSQVGFSVSLFDVIGTHEDRERSRAAAAATIERARSITRMLDAGLLTPPVGVTLGDYYESLQLDTLSTQEFIPPSQPSKMFDMVRYGSKGKESDFHAIYNSIGQQKIGANRISDSIYAFENTTEPEDQGFIPWSYVNRGINPRGLTAAAGEARNALASAAISTADAGKSAREANKVLESCVSNYTAGVWKPNTLVQVLYGESGADFTRYSAVKIPYLMLSDDDFRKDWKRSDAEWETLVAERNELRDIQMELERRFLNYEVSSTIRTLIDVYQIVENISRRAIDNKLNTGKLTSAAEKVDRFIADLPYAFCNSEYRHMKAEIPEHFIAALTFTRIAIRAVLNERNMERKQITDVVLDNIFDECWLALLSTLVDAGKAVGIITAQCTSEMATQLVLNTKHRSGGGGGNDTDPVARVREITSAYGNDKMGNPHMMVFPKGVSAKFLSNRLEMMRVGRFVSSTSVLFEEFGTPKYPTFVHEAAEIKKAASLNIAASGNVESTDGLSSWCVRFEIDRESMSINGMSMSEIMMSLRSIDSIYSVAGSTWIRCYLRTKAFKSNTDFTVKAVDGVRAEIMETLIRGVQDVRSSAVMTVDRHSVDDSGRFVSKSIEYVKTDGSMIRDVFELPIVDSTLTSSDDIVSMYECLGVGAARDVIMHQLATTLGADMMHTGLYADEMCYLGNVTNMLVSGLGAREENSLLMASFNSSNKRITTAAIESADTPISGLSACLMVGSAPKFGDQFFKLAVDHEVFEQREEFMENAIDDL